MKRIHYAWWVCVGCALLIYCTAGLAVNAYTIYQPFILRENGFSNAQSSPLITVRSLAAFLSSMLAERVYRLFTLRVSMALAGLASALGFVVYSLSDSYAGYCAASALIGVGFGIGTMTPISVLLGRWFVKDRLLAASICSAATGLAIFGIPSLLTWLIQRRGLHTTFLMEGAAIALLSAISFILIRNDPRRMGLSPYGEGQEIRARQRTHGNVVLDLRDRLLVAPLALASGVVTSVGYGHLTVYMTSMGYDPGAIAAAITVCGVALMLGKLLFGTIAEHIGNRRTHDVFGLILIAGMLLCCLAGKGLIVLYAAVAVYGAGLALTTVGLTTLAADWSVPDHYRATVEQLQTGYFAGALLFSPVPGIIADHAGGAYLPSFILFLACSVYMLTAIEIVYRRKRRQNGRWQ